MAIHTSVEVVNSSHENEPSHEKTNILHMCENKDADQLRGNREADQTPLFSLHR